MKPKAPFYLLLNGDKYGVDFGSLGPTWFGLSITFSVIKSPKHREKKGFTTFSLKY